MTTSLQFIGAAGTVTGSKYLLRSGDQKILVDCGMFQGLKSLRLQNWDGFPIPPSEVDAIILTHAHIDHSGYIPRFIKNGFRGKIYCTPATRDLCAILLPDAGYLAEEEADYLNRHHRSKHSPALPLFTVEDAKASLDFFVTVDLNDSVQIGDNISFQFHYAGHILGASSVLIKAEGKRIFFTGDIGRLEDPILFAPATPPPADYVITESTYGNRLHSEADPLDVLEELLQKATQDQGVIIIPSFAVGRAQELMYYLWQLKKQKRLPGVPMFLNSPMATDVNALFIKYHDWHRLSEEEAKEICKMVKYVRTTEDSIDLNTKKGPMLIISASGMISGGRVLHHIKAFGPKPNTVILLAGFQAAGTRGESLLSGATELKIHGEYVPIRAQVKTLESLSAHADYQEILDWFSSGKLKPPHMTFITHGEPSAADALRLRFKDKLGWPCMIPVQNQIVELS